MYIDEKRSNMPMKTIREVTEITGVTEKALRYYDEKDVLHPTDKNPSGRREWLYDDSAIWRIRQIALYRAAGLSIELIRCIMHEEQSNMKRILDDNLNRIKTERDNINQQLVLTEMLLIVEQLNCSDETKQELKRELSSTIERRKEGTQ